MSAPHVTTLRLDRFAPDRPTLDAAQEVHRAIYRIRDTEQLAERLLAEILERIPAKRGAVLLPDLQPMFEINTGIVAQAQRELSAILVPAPASLLCAPLRLFDSPFGAIYLENPKPNAFSARDLHLLAAIVDDAAEALDHAKDFELVRIENRQLRDSTYLSTVLIGNSGLMRQLRRTIKKVAPTDSPILILGPTGTGKELVALAIHDGSGRTGPFVPLNCSTLRGDMVESDLFGHEKGAFTGAAGQKKGQVEVAAGGTLFLDEIGELPLPIQAILLRFLQTQEFRRVGSTQTLFGNVRIVAATNRDLEKWVQEGKFREDLFFRLQGIEVRPPALSEIREDIPLLAAHFVEKLAYKRRVSGISKETMKLLTEYHWPGNIRQLQSMITRALDLGESESIEPEDVIDYLKPRKSDPVQTLGYHASMAQHQRMLIEHALARTKGNIAEAAILLGISRTYLYQLLKDLKIKPS